MYICFVEYIKTVFAITPHLQIHIWAGCALVLSYIRFLGLRLSIYWSWCCFCLIFFFFYQFFELWNEVDSWLWGSFCLTIANFSILLIVQITDNLNAKGWTAHHWFFFPSLFHVQLNLQRTGTLGEPPPTLPTVSDYERHFYSLSVTCSLPKVLFFSNFHR